MHLLKKRSGLKVIIKSDQLLKNNGKWLDEKVGLLLALTLNSTSKNRNNFNYIN